MQVFKQDLEEFKSTYYLPTFEFMMVYSDAVEDSLLLDHTFVLIGAKPPTDFRIIFDPGI